MSGEGAAEVGNVVKPGHDARSRAEGAGFRRKVFSGLAGRYGTPTLLILAFLAAWQGAVTWFHIPSWLLPSPWLIATTVVSRWDTLLANAWVTLPTVIFGFALAFAIGVGLAVVIRFSPALARALYPLLLANQAVPIIAVAPILVSWFGFTFQAKLVIVMLICFFPICVNAVDGFRAVDPEMVQMMRTLGASARRVFWDVEVPTALPFLMSGVRVAVSVSVVGAVVSEWVGASAGLGHFIMRSASQLATPQVFAALLVLSAMGVGLFALVAVVERLLMPWYFTEKRSRAVGE